ncbi:MAG: hypothetical protein IJS24_03035 [Eubacterium sp.]|nr:hypothetical protein [Eubacterium sp.]
MVRNGKRVIAIAMTAALSFGMFQAGYMDASAAKKVKLSKVKLTIEAGKKAMIKLKNVSKKDVKKIRWTTSDKKVVEVSPAKKSIRTTVKAVAAGKATVKAKIGKKSYSCKVTVTGKKVEQNIAMIRDTYATYVGTAVGVRPFALGADPVDMSRLSYKSSDTSVAKIVGDQGAVEGVKTGTATITITTDMGAKLSATVKVFASKDDADEANDFYQKQVNERVAELKKEGVTVNDGDEPIGLNGQNAARDVMVKEFSDTYLANVKNGKKYQDNTPADVIASVRSVFDVEETAKKAQLEKDIKAYLEPLEKAKTTDEIIAFNEKVIEDGEYGFWISKFGQNTMNADDTANGGVKLEIGVPILKMELVPATLLERKSDFQDPEKVKRLENLVKETLRLAGETDADIDKNAPQLVKVFEAIAPKMTLMDALPQIMSMTPEEQAKYMKENELDAPQSYIPGIDAMIPGLNINKIYKELGAKDEAVILSMQTKNCWTGFLDFLKTGTVEQVRELMKFCVAYKYVGFTESGYKAQILFALKNKGFTMDPTNEQIKKDYNNKAIKFLCDHVGFEICGEYTEKYLGGEQMKADLSKLINLYKEEYKAAFSECKWMSEQGKAAAIKKVDTMEYVIGDSGKCDLFRLHADLQTAGEGGSIFSNAHKVAKNDLTNFMAILGKKMKGQDLYFFTVASEGVTPMIVNASYGRTSNVFCIYAGIIGDETYKPGNDAYNIGRIGYITGHEIGHAFDAEGAKYNEAGDMIQWMTEEDVQYFNQVQQKCINLFDNYSVSYDKPTKTIYYADGKKELAENMADFSAAEISVRIGKKIFDQAGMKELFKQFSLLWTKLNFDPGIIVVDVHGPGPLRGIVPFQMQDEFYETFGIKEGDAMYIAPENRVRLWS